MLTRTVLQDYLTTRLQPQLFKDYCPNGLQVEGRQQIRRIVTGVTACQALLDVAVQQHADAVIVHHGYFWKGESPTVRGVQKKRLHTLLQNDINLFAYHLPLDLHADIGNNVQLAAQMGWSVSGELPMATTPSYGLVGRLSQPMPADALAAQLTQQLGQKPLHIVGHQRTIETIAWCTGAAQDFIEDAARAGVDAYISGEISERTVHSAREWGIDYFAAGHHATERYGIQALTAELATVFSAELTQIECVDIANPV